MADRYFIEADPGLEARLDSFLSRLKGSLTGELPQHIHVLLLGGGYGRGEGGIYRGAEIEGTALYNDLEFYVVTTGTLFPAALKKWCEVWSEEGHKDLGIEVEFKLLSWTALRASQPSMFYYDLAMGHRVVFGATDFMRDLPESLSRPELIPLVEASRLLFNRGSGLLFCQEVLAQAAGDSTFIERNHAKVRLALADAVLAANGAYTWSCLARERRIQEGLSQVPANWPRLQEWHAAGVEFKLLPRHEDPEQAVLVRRQEELVRGWLETFLWVESLRLKRGWPDALAYARQPGRLFPETSRVKNLALRGRDLAKTGKWLPHLLDYPRASLYRALVTLLAGGEAKAAARQLGLAGTEEFSVIVKAYREWWGRYN